MEDPSMIKNISDINLWMVQNQALFTSYVLTIIKVSIIVFFGVVIARMVSRGFNRAMLIRRVDATIADFLSALVRYGIIIFTFIIGLECIGIQSSSVVAALGTAGLAVGLSLQKSLANLAAGVLLVTFRPFRSGEYVDLSGTSGTVLNVQIFSTTLRSSDGKIVIVPNKKVIDGNIVNFSREKVRRNEFIISVGYDSNIEFVKKLLIDIIESDDRILKNREITVRLNELGASSINFIVRVWSKSSDLQNVYWDILERIKCDFDKNGITFPYS